MLFAMQGIPFFCDPVCGVCSTDGLQSMVKIIHSLGEEHLERLALAGISIYGISAQRSTGRSNSPLMSIGNRVKTVVENIDLYLDRRMLRTLFQIH